MPAKIIGFLCENGAKVVGVPRVFEKSPLLHGLEVVLQHENWKQNIDAPKKIKACLDENNLSPGLGRSGSWAIRFQDKAKGIMRLDFSTDKEILEPALEKILRLKS